MSTKLDLISGVLLLPLRHPVPVTKLLTDIDHLSGGQLIVEVGVGSEYPDEWDACGVPLKERGSRMDEALEVVTRLRTEEHVTHDWRFYPLNDVTLMPRPLRQPNTPWWIGGRLEASQRRAAKWASGWFPLPRHAGAVRDRPARHQALRRRVRAQVRHVDVPESAARFRRPHRPRRVRFL